MARKCWAYSTGKCEGKMSGEHLFSKGLFDGKNVIVSGFMWQETGEEKTIGLDSITAKILCSHHNNSLSVYDTEASKLSRYIKEIEFLLQKKESTVYKKVIKKEFAGSNLEQWFKKTAINIFINNNKGALWYNEALADCPPADIVTSIFDNTPLLYPKGLYTWQKLGDKYDIKDTAGLMPLYNNKGLYAGAIINIKTLSFLIWFDGDQEPPIKSPSSVYRHSPGFIIKNPDPDKRKGHIVITWPNDWAKSNH